MKKHEDAQPTDAQPTDAQMPAAAPAAEEQGTDSHSGSEVSLLEELALAQTQAAKNHDLMLRAVADLENYRKRAQREKESLKEFATEGILQDLLPVLDNLKMGLKAAQEHASVKEISKGFEMVHEQILQVFEKHGVKEINPNNESFDPNLHDCVSQIPSTNIEEGKVAEVIRSGYQLHSRLLRPATVAVSSGTPNS